MKLILQQQKKNMVDNTQIYPEGKFVKDCHMCHKERLFPVLDLGFQPHSDLFLRPEQLNDPLSLYPLRLVSCPDCGLLQIDFLVDPRILYQKEYLYEASITATGRKHYNDMAKSIINKFSIKNDSLAIDLGSNVGVLLEGYKDNGLRVLGVDPAPIVAQKAIDRGIDTIIDFFDQRVAQKILETRGKAKIISGTNVFAHIHDLDSAVEGMKILLEEDGVIVIEAPYAVDFIEHLEYDTIYHQHVGYLSVKPMREYFQKFGLELFDLDYSKIHGGSLRYYIGHKGVRSINKIVEEYLNKEESFGLYDPNSLALFRERVEKQRMDLLDLLIRLKKEGKKIIGISAPAKGNTLLNYCDIDTKYLDFLTEKSLLKIGRYSPATSIPIYGDDKVATEKPDYALILAWNFAEEIMKNMSTFKESGGKFIIPIPYPKIV